MVLLPYVSAYSLSACLSLFVKYFIDIWSIFVSQTKYPIKGHPGGEQFKGRGAVQHDPGGVFQGAQEGRGDDQGRLGPGGDLGLKVAQGGIPWARC